MTKEDIEIEACIYEDGCHNPNIQRHFSDGAEWAMETLMTEVCEWIMNTPMYGKQPNQLVEELKKVIGG